MRIKRLIIAAGILLALIILIWHLMEYKFITDDAFISFRYAHNLSDGNGLVFNLGERVEGYTNFLWVLILAFFNLLGLRPDTTALPLSIFITIILFILFNYYNFKLFGRSKTDLFLIIAPIFLALNRSFAIWSTGGLETRLFTFLIFMAIVNMLLDDNNETTRLRKASAFFTLAALTRPEGILLFGTFFGYEFIRRLIKKEALKPVLVSSTIFILVIGAHFIFRYFYYGYLFPNTFYAKVTGHWFDMGFYYLLLFVLEYGLILFIPPLLTILSRTYEPEYRRRILNFRIAFAPYFIYLLIIGGDHFEFRQLDIFIPFMAIMIQESIRSGYYWLRARIGYKAVGAMIAFLIISLAAYTVPGWLSHRNFPKEYNSGIAMNTTTGNPVLDIHFNLIDTVHKKLADRFVCIRQEEHKMAMEQVFYPQAMTFKSAIEHGMIDTNESICLWCVGTIPYYSNLTTIDNLGLTDEYVAHKEPFEREDKQMAHEKRADWNYVLSRRVVYISIHPSRFFYPKKEYFDENGLIADKMKLMSYLAIFKDQVMIFRSAFKPDYFQYNFGIRGVEFYFRDQQGRISHYTP